jgi:hypothetical protein
MDMDIVLMDLVVFVLMNGLEKNVQFLDAKKIVLTMVIVLMVNVNVDLVGAGKFVTKWNVQMHAMAMELVITLNVIVTKAGMVMIVLKLVANNLVEMGVIVTKEYALAQLVSKESSVKKKFAKMIVLVMDDANKKYVFVPMDISEMIVQQLLVHKIVMVMVNVIKQTVNVSVTKDSSEIRVVYSSVDIIAQMSVKVNVILQPENVTVRKDFMGNVVINLHVLMIVMEMATVIMESVSVTKVMKGENVMFIYVRKIVHLEDFVPMELVCVTMDFLEKYAS